MTVRIVAKFDEQAGITALSDDFMVQPSHEVAVVAKLTAGTPVTGCRVQFTLDENEKITAGTATWVNSTLGAHTATSAEKLQRPVTGVRLSVTDGTWLLQVRQV
jgi:hypothetical protein